MMMNNRMNNQQGDPRASLFLTSEKAVFCKIPVSRSSPIALHSPKSPKTLCWDLRRCFVSNQSEFLQRCESSEVILLAKWFAREKITTRDFFNIWQHIWKDNSTEFDNTWHYSCQLKDSNWISRGIFFFCPKNVPAQKQVSSIFCSISRTSQRELDRSCWWSWEVPTNHFKFILITFRIKFADLLFISIQAKYVSLFSSRFGVLCHGNFWRENLRFKYKNPMESRYSMMDELVHFLVQGQ